jgi:hypothetical protein
MIDEGYRMIELSNGIQLIQNGKKILHLVGIDKMLGNDEDDKKEVIDNESE